MKKCSVLLLALSLMLSFCACFKSNKISSLEEIMENGTEWGDEQLQQIRGCTLADMEKVWGKVDGELSKKYAYFWKVNDMVSVNVYCHKNAEIEHITGLEVYYHSDCGTFNEKLEQTSQSFRLSETEQETINNIIQATISHDVSSETPIKTTAPADNPQILIAKPENGTMENVTGIFDALNKLEYQPYTCDGLPEYRLLVADGTVYFINFSEKWVWRGNSGQAELSDELIRQLKESGMLMVGDKPLETP